MSHGLTITKAQSDDCTEIKQFIIKQAQFHDDANKVTLTDQLISLYLFDNDPKGYFYWINDDADKIGFVIHSFNFDCYTGTPVFFIEDLFINPTQRGQGLGKTVMTILAKMALEQGCSSMRWHVKEWNDQAKAFYQQLGATQVTANEYWQLGKVAIERMIFN
ncbi:MAG: GNAT family N-acetyltransferase [Pseudomonadota bacterium]